MQPMPPSISNLQLFGNNIFYSKGDEYGEFSPKKYYFNSKLIPLTPAGGPACTLSTDSVLCSDENRNLNLNSKNIGETSRDVWNLVDYSYNGISANDNPFLFRNNVAWFDNNMDVKFLSAGGAIKDMGPGYQIYLFGNHLGIVREPKDSFSKSFSAGGFTASNGDHIIYDGKDIGPGSGIVLFGDQIAYTYFKATDNGLLLPYIIVNGESLNVLKELSLEKYISASTDVFGLDLFDDHFLFYMSLPTSDPNKMSIHLFYDWKDVGTVEDTSNSSNSIMFGDHLVIEKDGHIIYDGKDLGSGSAPLLFENHIGFKVDDPDGMLKPYYLDGQTYLYGNNNISANLKTCYKYYLENDVPVSGNNVETNNTDAVSSIGSSVNEKNNSVNNVGSSGTQYGSDINNGDQAELDNTGVGNSTQSPNMDNGEGYTQLETDSGSSNQALSQNDQIAETIDAVKIPITQDLSKEIPEVYSSDSIPTLKDGEVLIKGRSTALGIEGMELNSSRQDMKVNDTYYLVDKNTLPTDYILSGISSIKVGDSIIPIYNISTKDDVLARNTQYDKDGVFKFDFNNSPSATNPTMRLVNSIAQTVDTSLNVLGKVPTTLIMSNPLIALSLLAGTASGALPSNDAIMGHIALNSYNKDADVTLAKFADIDTYSVQSGATQGQKEESVYNVVNNNIKFQDPARGLSNTLEQAVATGSGVCRDKTPALVAGLNAVGIPAAQVVSDGHTFAAVLNTDGSVNHYLDPMYYETYLPLQRPSVNANQIIKK